MLLLKVSEKRARLIDQGGKFNLHIFCAFSTACVVPRKHLASLLKRKDPSAPPRGIWLGISRRIPSRHYACSCRGACICCIFSVHASQTTLTCSHYLPGLYVELFFVREVAGSLVFPATLRHTRLDHSQPYISPVLPSRIARSSNHQYTPYTRFGLWIASRHSFAASSNLIYNHYTRRS